MADYTMSAEKVRELVTYLAKDFINDSGLSAIATLHSGVINGDKLAQLKQGGWEGVKISTGCNPEYDSAEMSDKKPWVLGDYSMNKSFCVTSIEPELRRNKALFDLTDDEVFNKFIADYIQKSFVESIFARSVFGFTGSTVDGLKNDSGSEGILKQAKDLIAGGDADASQAVAITTNTKAALRTGTAAIDLLFEVRDAMSDDLLNNPDAYIMVGKNFYSDLAYCARMCKHDFNESQYEELSNGYKKTNFDGITLIINPFIDGILKKTDDTDFQNKRAVIFASAPQYVHIGTKQSEQEAFESEVWYEKKDKAVYSTLDFNSGALIGSNKDYVIAY